MTRFRGLRTAIAFAILVVLHYTVRPFLGWWASPDFLVAAVLLASVRMRPGAAAMLGCALGLVTDALTPASFGIGALAMTGVASAASWLKAAFFADNIALNGFFFFLGKWAFDLVVVLSDGSVSGLDRIALVLVRSPLSAAVTAIAGMMMLVILRPLLDEATS